MRREPEARIESAMAALEALNEAVIDCRRCPRLVAWREQVAREKRAAFRDEDVLGPADAGLRRSGRARARDSGSRPPRTAATAPAGSSPATARATSCSRRCTAPGWPTRRSRSRATTGWRCAARYIVAAVRCAPPANHPTPEERGELRATGSSARWRCCAELHVVICLGGFAWESGLRLRAALGGEAGPAPEAEVRPRRRAADGEPWPLLGCFHPSQQNTFTGKLTPAMLDAVLARGAKLAWGDA